MYYCSQEARELLMLHTTSRLLLCNSASNKYIQELKFLNIVIFYCFKSFVINYEELEEKLDAETRQGYTAISQHDFVSENDIERKLSKSTSFKKNVSIIYKHSIVPYDMAFTSLIRNEYFNLRIFL